MTRRLGGVCKNVLNDMRKKIRFDFGNLDKPRYGQISKSSLLFLSKVDDVASCLLFLMGWK